MRRNFNQETSMIDSIVAIAIFAAGYAAAITTWGRLKAWINGAEAEAARLKSQADALVARAKAAAGR
jgi:type II secretory pathway pseudopilin PulG